MTSLLRCIVSIVSSSGSFIGALENTSRADFPMRADMPQDLKRDVSRRNAGESRLMMAPAILVLAVIASAFPR
ncbi:MAG TPA: hypothetical protein VFT22_23295 [Kofleriaceae bacterium]|nr:hypothetical protein [Kofleriaceae bacterium]